MRGWKILTFGAGVVALLFVIDWRLSTRAPAAAADASVEHELQALRAETARLRESVATLEAAKGTRPTGPTPQGLPPELQARVSAMEAAMRPDPGAPPQVEQTPEQEREGALGYARFLDERLAHAAAGRVDDAVGTELRTKVSEHVDDKSSLAEVKCSAELCRMLTRHKDGESYRAFQTRAFQEMERVWSGPVTFVVLEEPDATGRPLLAATYLGRSEMLPSPEPPR